MANRTRPIRIEFCVSDYEHQLIKNKMTQLGTHNMGAYLRKMAIDGYIIKVDYTEQKKLATAVSRSSQQHQPHLPTHQPDRPFLRRRCG